MSHLQFHSTNVFILRHAWLNPRTKHMTTGRINQVSLDQAHQHSKNQRLLKHFCPERYATNAQLSTRAHASLSLLIEIQQQNRSRIFSSQYADTTSKCLRQLT